MFTVSNKILRLKLFITCNVMWYIVVRHELHHEIVHLVDCLKHQKQHNQVCSLWTKNYGHSAAQNIALVRGVDQGAGAKEREVLLEGNQKFIRDLEKQVRGC